MTNQLTIPATIREQFEALIPYMVDFRPLIYDKPGRYWEMRLYIPESMIHFDLSDEFCRKNGLTIDAEIEAAPFCNISGPIGEDKYYVTVSHKPSY